MAIKSLGYVALPSPAVPTRVTANLADPTARVPTQALLVQAHPNNTGVLYVGGPNMNTTTGVGVYAVVPKPADATTGPFPSFSPGLPVIPAGLDASQVYIDGTAGDQAVVSLVWN